MIFENILIIKQIFFSNGHIINYGESNNYFDNFLEILSLMI